jgi:hypothetical protein
MNTIDAVLYINLDHRKDRKTSIVEKINKMGFNPEIVHRIPAIHNKECGHIGCGLSHIKALDLAIQNNWKRILILEDDFRFSVSRNVFDAYMTEATNVAWDVLLLTKCQGNFKETKGHLQKVVYCTTTPGYIVNDHYYKTLKANFMESVDIMTKELEIHIKDHTGPWATIGKEFQNINITAQSRIRYGFNGHWIEKIVSSPFKATKEFFGKDPIPNHYKNVELYTQWRTIATENKMVNITKPCRIRYGHPDTTWIEKNVSGPFRATNAFFGGDPYPTKGKKVQLFIDSSDISDMLIQEKLYPKLITCTAIDQHWKILQARDNFYVFEPVVGSQGGFSSDNF